MSAQAVLQQAMPYLDELEARLRRRCVDTTPASSQAVADEPPSPPAGNACVRCSCT